MWKGLGCKVQNGLGSGFSQGFGLEHVLGLALVSLSAILKLPLFCKTCLIS